MQDKVDEATQVENEDLVNWYKLKIGDVIKFGRISYKVTMLYIP